MKLITPGVTELIRLAKAGQFPSGNYLGKVALAPYHDFDSQVPVSVQQLILDTARKLESGELSTGYLP
jgi:basic membrane protein A